MKRRTLGEHHLMAQTSPEERLRQVRAPRRVVQEYDDNWNELPPPVCDVCRRPAPKLLSYGFLGKRMACPECIQRRARVREHRARVFARRPVRPK